MTDSLTRLTAALADRYRIERELGAGGMATVYLAQDLKHDRRVAIKVLRPELAAVIGAERFLVEIRTTANLQHPHILALFDSGQVDGTVFYVMPYVEGESLRDRLAREKQLPVDDAIRIAREIADALQYAHQRGVIHRDIKPENILLHGGHALVADFGIALAASKSESGQDEIYVQPYPATGQRWRISRDGGEEPLWTRGGSELVYRIGQEWWSVRVTSQGEFVAGEPELLARGPWLNVSGVEYAVSSDGDRLYLLAPVAGPATTTRLTVITNWFTMLRDLARRAGR